MNRLLELESPGNVVALGSPDLSANHLQWEDLPSPRSPTASGVRLRHAAPASDPDPEQVARLLYRQLRALAGSRPDLEDIVQTAVERALRALPRFEGRSALSTWTYGLAYRTLLDHNRWYRRYTRRFRSSEDDPVPDLSTSLDAQRCVEEVERARRLYAALDKLPVKKRVVVVLFELEGLTAREVSEIVGVSEGTVRSRLRDGRARLLELLSRDPLFDPPGFDHATTPTASEVVQ